MYCVTGLTSIGQVYYLSDISSMLLLCYLRLVQFVYISMLPFNIPPHTDRRANYWKLMGLDEPYLEWVPYMPGTTIQDYLILSQNVLLGTGTYYMPEQE